MTTFDRYLLREWLQILALVLAATVGLLLVQVLYDDFRALSELGAGSVLLARYVAVRLPSFLASVLLSFAWCQRESRQCGLGFVFGEINRSASQGNSCL